MKNYPSLNLEIEDYNIGDIIVVDNLNHAPKRVIYSERLKCFALQNKGSGNPDKFSNLTQKEQKNVFDGSLDDCFTLPESCRNKIGKIEFQTVKIN